MGKDFIDFVKEAADESMPADPHKKTKAKEFLDLLCDNAIDEVKLRDWLWKCGYDEVHYKDCETALKIARAADGRWRKEVREHENLDY
jgi:hypothetical protein